MNPSRFAVIAIVLGCILFILLNVWIVQTEPVTPYEKAIQAN
jgi:hypothetical protein